MIVTCYACKAHKFACFSKPTKKACPASCMAIMAVVWNHKSPLIFWMISSATLWKGSHQIKSSVPLWYFHISLRACIPLFSLPVTPSFFFSLLTSFSTPLFPHFSPTSFIPFTFSTFSFLSFAYSALVMVLFIFQAMSGNKANIINLFIYLSSYTNTPNEQLIHIAEQKWNTKTNTCI